jgi:hypothetical protein
MLLNGAFFNSAGPKATNEKNYFMKDLLDRIWD